MNTIIYIVLLLTNNMIRISSSREFLGLTPSVSKLATINRVIKNTFYKCRGKGVARVILAYFLLEGLLQPNSESTSQLFVFILARLHVFPP